MSYKRISAERDYLAATGKQVALGGRGETYDERYKRPADDALVARLNSAPVGTVATVRAVTFRKATSKTWANDFRADLNARQVASVLGEEPGNFEIREPERS